MILNIITRLLYNGYAFLRIFIEVLWCESRYYQSGPNGIYLNVYILTCACLLMRGKPRSLSQMPDGGVHSWFRQIPFVRGSDWINGWTLYRIGKDQSGTLFNKPRIDDRRLSGIGLGDRQVIVCMSNDLATYELIQWCSTFLCQLY